MSEGEIEVEAVTGYEVLPKEYIQELGSTKLFSTSNRSRRSENRGSTRGNWLLTTLTDRWSYDDVEIRDISLT